MTDIVTLVPFRGGEPRREFLWDHTKPILEEIGFPIHLGDSTGEWARAEAMNNASTSAGNWDVAILADADTIPDIDSIDRAISWVQSTRGAARPHMERWMLTESGTDKFLRLGREALVLEDYDKQWQGGGLLVVHRECWDKVGGFDERFVGWGREDTCFNLRALRRASWDRLPGDAWHLWHPRHKGGANRNSESIYNALLRGYKDDIEEWARDKGVTNPQEIF